MPVLTKNGNLSSKPTQNCTVKRLLKIEQIVRLTARGFKDDAIALVMGITPQYVSMLRRTPEYIGIDTVVRTNLVARHDNDLYTTVDGQEALLKEGASTALSVLKNIMLDPQNPVLAARVAQDWLDREGTHVKVSKTEIKKKVEFDFTEHDKAIEQDVLSALTSPDVDSVDALESFINSELDSEGQEELHKQIEAIKLEDIKATGMVQ